MTPKELSGLAHKYLDSPHSEVQELARGTLLLMQRYNNTAEQLRVYQEPPNSVKFFVEKHLSCDWHGSKDKETQRREWECELCGRKVDNPPPAVYSPCAEKVRLGVLAEVEST